MAIDHIALGAYRYEDILLTIDAFRRDTIGKMLNHFSHEEPTVASALSIDLYSGLFNETLIAIRIVSRPGQHKYLYMVNFIKLRFEKAHS